MIYPNHYIEGIKEYVVASHEIWKVSPAERTTYLKLDWNEATIQPSPRVYEGIKRLLNEGNFFNLYPMLENSELMELLANYTGLEEKNIQCFGSSDALHEVLTKVYLNQNSTVVVLSPSYDNFRLSAEATGAHVIYSDYTDEFSLDKEKFESDIFKYNPKMVYICNPNNPTGYCIPCAYIERLLRMFPGVLFLIDEAYCEFSGVTAAKLVPLYDNLVISRTMSKAFALANFRFGYMLSNEEIIRNINRVRNPKNITTFAQVAVVNALSDIPYMEAYVNEVRNARAYVVSELSKFDCLGKVYNSEGNFVLLKCPNQMVKRQYITYLRNENIFIRDVRQRPSVCDCVRITIGTCKQMERFLDCASKFVSNTF